MCVAANVNSQWGLDRAETLRPLRWALPSAAWPSRRPSPPPAPPRSTASWSGWTRQESPPFSTDSSSDSTSAPHPLSGSTAKRYGSSKKKSKDKEKTTISVSPQIRFEDCSFSFWDVGGQVRQCNKVDKLSSVIWNSQFPRA